VDAAETWFEGNVAFELRPQPEVGGKPNCANSCCERQGSS
jgi:hypothetical protein